MLGICMRHPSGERQTERREMENGEERDGAAYAPEGPVGVVIR
jgi:hypothetical protein